MSMVQTKKKHTQQSSSRENGARQKESLNTKMRRVTQRSERKKLWNEMKLNQPAKSWSIRVWIVVFEMRQVFSFELHESIKVKRRKIAAWSIISEHKILRPFRWLHFSFRIREPIPLSLAFCCDWTLLISSVCSGLTLRCDQVEHGYRFHNTMRKLLSLMAFLVVGAAADDDVSIDRQRNLIS